MHISMYTYAYITTEKNLRGFLNIWEHSKSWDKLNRTDSPKLDDNSVSWFSKSLIFSS